MSAIMEISTAVGCPMTCSYCPQKVHIQNYEGERMMSMRTFEQCLEKLPKHVGICFAGMVEPWVNQRATEMVILAEHKGHIVSVYTTCYGMQPNDIRILGLINFKHFTIHLPDADGVMKIKITEGYLEALRICSKIKGANMMVIGKLHPEVEKVVGRQEDGSRSIISRAGNVKEMFIGKKEGRLYCSASPGKLEHNVLLPNGNVLLCCMDYSHDHVIGNLLTSSYDQLFESEEYKRVQVGLLGESDILCRKCEIAANV